MENVNIAVVDSGLNYEYRDKYLKNKIIGGCSFIIENNAIFLIEDEYEGSNGHGTGCVSIINRCLEKARFYIIKISDYSGRTSSELLIEALRHLLKIDVDIINISLATSSEKDIVEMESICNQLYSQGKVIVASVSNDGEVSYPAYFKNVIGVDRDDFDDLLDYRYNPDKRVQAICDGYPELIPYTTKGILGGSSKASALFSAIIGLNMLNLQYKKNIYNQLINKNYFIVRDQVKDEIKIKKEDSYYQEIKRKIIKAINDYTKNNNCSMGLLVKKSTNLIEEILEGNPNNYINLVRFIEKKLKYNFDYESISIKDNQYVLNIIITLGEQLYEEFNK